MEHYMLNTLYEVLMKLQEGFEDIKLEQEEVGLEHLFGRYISENVISKEDIPGFNRSVIDGYAVISGDTFGIDESLSRRFDQVGQSEIGSECTVNLGPNECVYISSGAMMPPNADAVVSQYDVEVTGPGEVTINSFIDRWENVIRRGDDFKKGETFLKKGTRIGVKEMAVLAGTGYSHINVNRKLKIAVISTGLELVKPSSENIKPGKVRDINSHMICDAVKSLGAIPLNMGIYGDNSKEIESVLVDSIDTADIVIISGGSSEGTMDRTLNTIKRISGVEIITNRINIEPGHDTIVAKVGDKAIFGLPGSPISVLITAHLLIKPLIMWLNGAQHKNLVVKARCSETYKSTTEREEYVLVALDSNEDELIALPIPLKKGLLTSIMKGNGYIKMRASDEEIKKGQEVEVTLLENWF